MRYFVGFLLAIGLLILLIILLVGGGGKNKVPETKKPLTSYASTDAVAKLTIDGPINAQSIHQQTQITVGRDEVVFEQITGYEGNATTRKSYTNNQNAYTNFLYGLSHVGFTLGDTSISGDERGHCPLGNRYVFELIDNGNKVEHFWATSCGKPKTYGGLVGDTLTLFQRQVPDYRQLPHVSTSGSTSL
jgi:hypothetical protein